MENIELTKSLIAHEAIIVHGDDVPEGYIDIAHGSFGENEVTIAIPENLLETPYLINKLANDAVSCILKAMKLFGSK